MTTKELAGQLISITHSAEVVILSFHEEGQTGAVAFSIPNQRYHELFPAGEPALGEDIVVVIEQNTLDNGETTAKIQAVYDPNGDFIPVDEVSGDNLITAAENDVYAELRALRDQQVSQITLSIDELEDLAKEHAHESAKAGQVQVVDYGDLVTDQLGEERRGAMVSSPTPYLDKYTINLSDKVAKNPDKFQAFERENITQRVLISLVKQIQNSPLLIGLPGVGKTAIIEDLARQLLNTKDPFLKGKRITQISLANLMNASDGELFAYKLQKIIDELIANRETIIAFIDEIHQIVGTGASNSGSALDAGNILKPALSRDDLQIIGATTTKEFHDYIALDGALMRRFDVVEVPELSYHQTAKLLPKVGPRLNNSIDVPDDIYEKIMQFSQRYITDRYFPEKAIMLLDSALGAAKVNQHEILTVHDVAHIIQADYSIPEHVINQTTDDRFPNLYETLKARVIGQDDQIYKLVRKLINRAAGLADTSKPESFLFMGPTGVGKTELSKQLAISLFGAEENLIRFDMSEFKFAGTSLARFKTKLTTQVRHTPYAVLLLDEIEKADPEIMDLLLQVLDDGRLSDDYGRVINFKDLIIIMTTNSGAKAIMNREAKSDEVKNDPKRQANFEEQLELALQGDGYRPEFIARLGAILVFNVLKMPDVVRIVNLKLSQISRKAEQQGFKIIFTIDDVTRRIPSFDLGYEYVDGVRVPSSTTAEYLANEGYNPSRGVRPLDDVIATYVSDPVAEVIMAKRNGDYQDFDTFVFRALGNPPTNSPYGDWQIVFSTMKEGDNEFIS